jgi:hypothetical protein
MKRATRISILAILAFAIILLVRLPAAWLTGFAPPGVSCTQIAGSAWNGSSHGLVYNGATLGTLDWELHPLALFRGKLSAFVNLTRGQNFIRGDLEMGGGDTYIAHDLQAQMPLDPPLLPQLDSGYSGNISVNLEYLRVRKNLIGAVQGQVQATSLYSKRDRMALGGYSVTFPRAPAGNEPVGQVMSLDGPVDFQGTLKLTHRPQPGWLLSGKVRTKPETPRALVQQLAYLGAPDAEGFRSLSLEGTF